MSETNSNLAEALAAILKPIVEEAVQEANSQNGHMLELLKPKELAKQLNVPLSWIYEQSRHGNIPTHRLGRYLRFNIHEVLASQKK